MATDVIEALAQNIRPEWTVRMVQPGESAGMDRARLAELDESALVGACLSGHREAFDIIVERHRRAVYQLCYRFAGNHEDACARAQDAFIRAFRGLARFRGQSSLSTWLYRIAVNVCLNRVSAKQPQMEPLDARPHFDHRAIDPASELLRGERAEQVRAAIARLPKKQRATVILRVYHELSHEEISKVLGSSVGAVKANFFHALGNLKKLL
jgi:RNA polymerase sigma-70 factor (ECF subfamily)